MLPLFVRRLSYSPKIRRLVCAIGLQKTAKSLYYRFVRKGGAIQISAGGVAGRFFPENINELRIVESCAQEHALARLLSEVRPEDIVYDVGAHHGLYSVLLAQKVKSVIAFEPEQECHARLQRNIQINGLSNITTYCKGVGDRESETILYLGYGVGAINSGHLSPDFMKGGQQTIHIVRGDIFRQSQNLPAPTVLKIDVEGYEGAVLEGFRESLSLPECRLVCCEIHPLLLPHPATKETVVDALKSFGFSDVQLFAHSTEFHAFAYKGARQKE